MRLRLAALLVYLTLDFANPLMPGAVCFDPADSVDGVTGARPSTTAVALTVAMPVVRPAPPAVHPPMPSPQPRAHGPVERPRPRGRTDHAAPLSATDDD